MTSPADAVAAIRDHRLCRTIRRGFVAISAASSANSMIGTANRGPSQQRLRQQRVDDRGEQHRQRRRNPVLTRGVAAVR